MALTHIGKRDGATFSPIVSGLISYIWRVSAEFRNRLKIRKELGGLSARYLRDIGLTEQDIFSIGDYPLSRDSAEKLKQIARQRASNW